MYAQINGENIFAATGGKTFVEGQPTMIFLHGSGMDHRAFNLQTRWAAWHGFNVFAPDLPGHSLSSGQPLCTIEDMAQWLWQFVDRLGIDKVSICAHSQGVLVALEAATLQPARLTSALMIAGAAAIPVNEQLLDLARNHVHRAVDAMLQWSFGNSAQLGCYSVPGFSPIGIARKIMVANPLAVDLNACNQYQNGLRAAETLFAPSRVLAARLDKMTPLKSAQVLADIIPGCQNVHIVEQFGHMLPIEAPLVCVDAIKNHFKEKLCLHP